MSAAPAPALPRRAWAEVFLVFLYLGLTSFGGPVAHLGYFRREFVDKRHWLDETAEETPEMLAAIDEGLRSLKEKGVTPLEEVRAKIPQWAIKSG